MASTNKFNLKISSINVNSMNVSTLGFKNSKTYKKIEGVTGKRNEVILLCDVRAGDCGNDLKKLFRLTRNGNYDLFLNSSKDSRGVGVAIKRNIFYEVKGRFDDPDENFIALDIVIKGKRITICSVYGPNENDPGFFLRLKGDCERFGNEVILGGDFNTILDNSEVGNLDREGGGRTPNIQNSRVINSWITNGEFIDPFRALFPEKNEVSHVAFRENKVGGGGTKSKHKK